MNSSLARTEAVADQAWMEMDSGLEEFQQIGERGFPLTTREQSRIRQACCMVAGELLSRRAARSEMETP